MDSKIIKRVLEFKDTNQDLIDEIRSKIKKLSAICHRIDESWSGSPFGHHAYYYYNDFTPPPSNARWNIEWGTIHGVPKGWTYRQGEEVKQTIESHAGFSIEEFSQNYETLLISAESLKEDILIELSDFEFSEKFVKEKQIYDSIENYNLGDVNQLRADYINDSRVMGSFMSRDTQALTAGRIIPAHITTMAGINAASTIIENVDKFLSLVARFDRQVTKKGMYLDDHHVEGNHERLEKILNKFHRVAQQLTLRHNDRETIIISDEYDVQDLLHALLKIEFDDIRPEEWTPSYAGSASRMDFLLKNEELVIEVKIATKKLREKELSEQLILDIARYKTHPNCKILYCFVYDPGLLLTKQTTIINDLQKKHDGLDVKIIIRPLA